MFCDMFSSVVNPKMQYGQNGSAKGRLHNGIFINMFSSTNITEQHTEFSCDAHLAQHIVIFAAWVGVGQVPGQAKTDPKKARTQV
jgi:hypothetical protein